MRCVLHPDQNEPAPKSIIKKCRISKITLCFAFVGAWAVQLLCCEKTNGSRTVPEQSSRSSGEILEQRADQLRGDAADNKTSQTSARADQRGQKEGNSENR